jgi:NTE family protein
MSKDESFLDQIRLLIRNSNAFPGVSDDCLRSIGEAATWLSIRGGNTLFSQGDPSEAMYIIVNGLLGATLRKSSGEEITIGRLGPGEVIGEMGCINGEPRSATIRALRTSELLAVSRDALYQLARKHPAILLSLYRTVVGRLRSVEDGKPARYRPRTFCLLPSLHADNTHAFARDLVAKLGALGPTFLVTKQEFADATSDQFGVLEAAYEYVVYLAERSKTSWSRLCLSQADCILIVVRGTDAATPIRPFDGGVGAEIPIELVLLWPANIVAGKTTAWIEALCPARHYHVRWRSDVGRLARLLTGRGTGLVLSGGGARGLAHVGVGRALADHGVPIDAICGTSIGAYIGGALAMEWDLETLRNRVVEFSRKHPLRELVVPRWSLLSGRGLRVSAEKWFGEWNIEDTPIRYACVTTNLTTCGAATHRRGNLKTWVRASCSLPGVFPPVYADDALHVDGGLVNNLPTDIIRGMGADFVLAVDVGVGVGTTVRDEPGRKLGAAPIPNILELLVRIGSMNDEARGSAARQQCDVLLTPNVQHLGVLNWRAYDEAIKSGYDCAVAKIDQIKLRIVDARSPAEPTPLDL